MTSSSVHLRGGLIVAEAALRLLWQLEEDAFTLTLLEDGRLRVQPSERLTPELRATIRLHRDELVKLVGYTPDDSHLFSDDPEARHA
ncbi:MAG TPA: hypothetical protein VNJ02_01265 [Vicinamibacterales bacterium]|nr:hypothetical protein [Vicinamibacterales bacterium]